jgi:hypothetical protein
VSDGRDLEDAADFSDINVNPVPLSAESPFTVLRFIPLNHGVVHPSPSNKPSPLSTGAAEGAETLSSAKELKWNQRD